MTHQGIGKGYDLNFSVVDPAHTSVYLCIGDNDNRVLISHTSPASREAAVLSAIDDLRQWATWIDVWLVAETGRATIGGTMPVKFFTHVKPYYGALTLTGFGTDSPPLTYAGNGSGRLLSRQINGRYYFTYANRLETEPARRGFDCTTFPMALFEIRRLPGSKTGMDLADAANAVPCDLEELTPKQLHEHFAAGDIPRGIYIVFGTWGSSGAGHVLLYDADLNWLFEFNSSPVNGYQDCPAPQRNLTPNPTAKWWVRRLGPGYRPHFA
jgi:hypothetical protein